jgi:hypothetical protein
MMGRPSKYRKEYCRKLITFFDAEPYEDVKFRHYRKGKLRWVETKRLSKPLPTLRGFAKHIKVHIATVYNWIDPKHASFQQEFLDAFTRARDIRKWVLVQGGLAGVYNPLFAKFTAINETDMRDTKDVRQSGEVKHRHYTAEETDLLRAFARDRMRTIASERRN